MGPGDADRTPSSSGLDLIRSAAGGDAASIEILLQRHLPALRAFVRARAGLRVRAYDATSDLVQTVCVRALEGAGSLHAVDEASFRHWLYTAALRVIFARNRFHRARRRALEAEAPPPPPGSETEPGSAELPAASPTPSRIAGAREDLARVADAFAKLSAEERDVILLARFEDLSHAEIAEHLGCSEEAARQRLSRAVARLWALSRAGEPPER